jgi:hypothetical protein
LWCGGGHLHKDFPEKGNASSTPECCNYQLAEGEKAHPANYRCCKHAKEEMRKKPQGTPKTTSGRVFSSKTVKPHLSFAAALRGQADNQPHQEVAANTGNTDTKKTKEQKTGQAVLAPNVNSDALNMGRALTVVEKIMAELKGTASEEAKFLAIAKIVFKLMKGNGK